MSRIIDRDSAGRQRAQLVKAIAVALRELGRQTSPGDEARDLAAFIAAALKTISEGIDSSVAAWEKRGYWVKADRFRLEWAWTGSMSSKMQIAVAAGAWEDIARMGAQIAGKFNKVRISEHHRLGRPWLGAFKRLEASSRGEHP
jgi:hypothetical protein